MEHIMIVSYNSTDFPAIQAMFSNNPEWSIIPEAREERGFRPRAASPSQRIRSKDSRLTIRALYIGLALQAVDMGLDYFKAYSVEERGVTNSVDVKGDNVTIIINNVTILNNAPIDSVKAMLEQEKKGSQ